jgi:AcrR family transcriptional regulator
MSKPSTIRRKPPQHYHHGNLRRALLDMALRIIEEKGVEAVTTRALARRLGVSHGAPAHHFHNREALILEVATEGFRTFADALEIAMADAPSDPGARICAIGLAYVRFAVQHPAHVRVMFKGIQREGLRRPPELEREIERAHQVLVDATVAMVGAGAPSGFVRDLLFGNWSLVHGMAMLWIDGPAKRAYKTWQEFEEAAAQIFRRMVAGIKREAAG